MRTVNIKTRCQTCKEDMDKILLEKIAVLEKAFELACKYGCFDSDSLLREAKEELKSE